jgi:hypothetical protein
MLGGLTFYLRQTVSALISDQKQHSDFASFQNLFFFSIFPLKSLDLFIVSGGETYLATVQRTHDRAQSLLLCHCSSRSQLVNWAINFRVRLSPPVCVGL